LNVELENNDYRSDLLKGMNDYFTFIETSYPHLKSHDNRLIPFVQAYDAQCGKRIWLVGLNSAWMCRKSHDEREIAIGEYQIIKAMDLLKAHDSLDIVMNLFHHPVNWLWEADGKICKKYFNNSILLCGHLHDAEGVHVQELDSRYYQFQAGAAYEGSEHPNRFQYVTFDWDKNKIRLDFRKFAKDTRRWILDSEKGKDGSALFAMTWIGKEHQEPPPEAPVMPASYRNWLIDQGRHMDTEKLCGKSEVIKVQLPEIFIPLYAQSPDKQTSVERFIPHDRGVEIEALIGQRDCLLIEGHAGSGKTTLMKHLAYSLAQESGPKGLDGFLPVLIFLKDLRGFSACCYSVEAILSYYLERIGNVLDMATVEKFSKVKKALFLLDGLDEMEPQERQCLIQGFGNLKNKQQGSRIVLTSRPHGLEGEAMKRFGENHIKILSLNMDQIQDFIRKWFANVYSSGSRIGQKNAEGMIGEVKAHKAIDQLIDNPLMLTAVCILYNDGKELPSQRAELYKKFVDNMLYRRFQDNEKVHEFLMALAFHMHEKRLKAADRVMAVDMLSKVYRQEPGENEHEYRKRIENLFDYIEPRCGLLKYEQGEYLFWHLTFQEFLTARYIVDNRKDYDRAISNYWGQDWYQEVIELYIGYLSIENRKWANDIVEAILKAEDPAPYKRWLLASKSVIDIHKNRRDPTVLTKTKDRLLEIIGSGVPAKVRAEAGETLGRLGDPRDLKEFIQVDGGTYSLSVGTVTLTPFEIGKYPVTNRWFEAFIQDGGYENAAYWTEEGKKWLDANRVKHPYFWYDRKWNCPNSPVVGVNWYEAAAFARWLTIKRSDGYEYRLLTEEEWEAAASGQEGRQYPWGNEWDDDRCNSKELKLEKTTPVGIFPKGDTPDGISDLGGNVWEWTTSDYNSKSVLNDFAYDSETDKLWQKYDDTRDDAIVDELISKWNETDRQMPVVRGGSWWNDEESCRSSGRSRYFPDIWWSSSGGFRCARTVSLCPLPSYTLQR
jgi:formylglycine-generating enzyme required for sulfatase activity/energy-coupling factor transporter ATP-binding protein EcfA2